MSKGNYGLKVHLLSNKTAEPLNLNLNKEIGFLSFSNAYLICFFHEKFVCVLLNGTIFVRKMLLGVVAATLSIQG